MISHHTVRPVPEKLTKMLKIPIPTSKKQVRSLLGLLGYYRRFVHNFATLSAPLTEIIRMNANPFKWANECQAALEKLQNILNNAPVLLLPDCSKPFVLRCDASSVGLGAVLLQNQDTFLHPVCYASRKLLDRETRYSLNASVSLLFGQWTNFPDIYLVSLLF